jgi:hypothetical protein
MNGWPHRCPCGCNAMARSLMPPVPQDLSRRRRLWHYLHLTRTLTPEQQELLRAILAQFDGADRAFQAGFATPTLAPSQREAARSSWRRLTESSLRSWRSLGLDKDLV